MAGSKQGLISLNVDVLTEKTCVSTKKEVYRLCIPHWDLLTWDFMSEFPGVSRTTEIYEKACVHVVLTGEGLHGINQNLKEI